LIAKRLFHLILRERYSQTYITTIVLRETRTEDVL